MKQEYIIRESLGLKAGQNGCLKCGGFVVEDRLPDPRLSRGLLLMHVELVCLNCGAREATDEKVYPTHEGVGEVVRKGESG